MAPERYSIARTDSPSGKPALGLVIWLRLSNQLEVLKVTVIAVRLLRCRVHPKPDSGYEFSVSIWNYSKALRLLLNLLVSLSLCLNLILLFIFHRNPHLRGRMGRQRNAPLPKTPQVKAHMTYRAHKRMAPYFLFFDTFALKTP